MSEADTYHKVGYDARLEYYKLVSDYMMSIAHASAIGNFGLWHRLMRQLFGVTKPYTETKAQEDFVIKMNKASKLLDQYNITNNLQARTIISSMLDLSTHEANDSLYMALKDMMLPTKGTESGEFSADTFLAGSQ